MGELNEHRIKTENIDKLGSLDFKWAHGRTIQKFLQLQLEVAALPDGMLRLERFRRVKEFIYSALQCSYCVCTMDRWEMRNHLPVEEAIRCELCPIGQHAHGITGVLDNGCHSLPVYLKIAHAKSRDELVKVIGDCVQYLKDNQEELS